MAAEGELQNLVRIWFIVITSLSYCYLVPRKIPKGKMRLLFLLPIIPLFTLLPSNLSSVHLVAITFLFVTWLGNYRLLLFSFDQGPLSSHSHPSLSLPGFISTACLPIKMKQHTSLHEISQKRSLKSPLNYAIKVLLLALVLRIYDYRQNIHPYLMLLLYCCHLYFIAEILLALCAAPARFALGIEIEPQFDEPYLSTSLQDFWGRRWNLMVHGILRPTVYEPVRSITMLMLMGTEKRRRWWSLLSAVLATFLVSGLMHELFYFYLTRVSPTWEVTLYFVLHGICTVVEIAVKKALKGKFQMHRAVSGFLTIGFVVVTSFWLFFPQLIRNGVDVRFIGEYGVLMGFVKDNLTWIWEY